MRIGIDGLPLSKLRTGVGHYTFELARALALVSPADEFQLLSPRPYAHAVDPATEPASPQNLNFIQVEARGLNRHWWTLGLASHLRRNPVALFHGTNYDVPLRSGCPTVLTIHDLSSYLHAETQTNRVARRARYRLPIMSRLATIIVTPSHAVRNEVCELLRVNPDKVVVVPDAPRTCFRPLMPSQSVETRRRLQIEDDFLLFVGTIEPRKNLNRLVQAFERVLSTTNLAPQLVIAGTPGWLTDELFSYVAQSQAVNRIRWTGYLTDEDLCALYSSCRLFIYPSLYEGFGLPPLEAMACGAPVITSRIPSIMEVVGDSARLVDPTSVEDLAQSMISLCNDSDEVKKLSCAGLKKAGEFSWERTARQTYNVYQTALSGNNKKPV